MVWHDGELAVQTRAGVVEQARKVGAIIGENIPAAAAHFLGARPYVIVATAGASGEIRASILAGEPGFATAVSDRSVRILPTSGHIESVLSDIGENSSIGLLAIDPSTRRRMRVNGRASASGSAIVITTREVYSNCPQYIHSRTVERGPARTPTAMASASLTLEQQAWIAHADTFYIASAHPEAGADASHRGGAPGFVRVESAGRLAIPDYSGNNMFNTLGNLETDPRCALLFVDGATGATLQLHGRAEVRWDGDPRLGDMPGAMRIIDIGIDGVVETRDAVALRWK